MAENLVQQKKKKKPKTKWKASSGEFEKWKSLQV